MKKCLFLILILFCSISNNIGQIIRLFCLFVVSDRMNICCMKYSAENIANRPLMNIDENGSSAKWLLQQDSRAYTYMHEHYTCYRARSSCWVHTFTRLICNKPNRSWTCKYGKCFSFQFTKQIRIIYTRICKKIFFYLHGFNLRIKFSNIIKSMLFMNLYQNEISQNAIFQDFLP